ncbi:Protoporphyrinogen oxidase [Wolfiporia cocos MD-104 SS10]|uniref:Protoporphyrinogen oxidase n=1 Tax=Wolfiporia cocos (strain MD-104) TaxID=742152 RepID=A0A2H3IYM1_WOLCO|nr:Protoporphyrinogen oxidase [Wolfiporia cocos MD-104 SS10]
MASKHIAVLGGGLTGLSSAFHLSRRFPRARITLLEKSQRLGGWVRSKRVNIRMADGSEASVLLEAGPRTLRPNGLAVLELVNLLGLSPSLITVPRTAPAARSRFLHIEGIPGLLRVPTSLRDLLTSPLARTLVPAVLKDAFAPANRPQTEHEDDESVDAFLTRRFGAEFARSFGSALVHGIYAADARELSARTAFPSLLALEARGYGSVVRGAVVSAIRAKKRDKGMERYDLGDVQRLMKGVSVYSFRDGMETLVEAVKRELDINQNVEVLTGEEVIALRKADGEIRGFEVKTASGRTIPCTHLVSALPLQALHRILHRINRSPSDAHALPPLPHLTANTPSSVTVVNLILPSAPGAPAHPPGFGYLVPRPPGGYPLPSGNREEETERGGETDSALGVLGTVFDSCALSAQDTPGAPLAKVTMMLGGPYPPRGAHLADGALVARCHRTLARHLGADVSALGEPLYAEVHRHEGCIPTPGVGHLARMREMREAVRREWGEGAEVVGAEVGGVSVGECVEMGRAVGRSW